MKSENPAPDIDKIYLDMSRAYTNLVTLEAEDATLIKNAQDQPRVMNTTGASGGKTVGWLGQSTTYKMVYNNVSVQKAGNYKVSLWYYTGENRSVTVKTNGTNYQLNNLNSGAWNKSAPAIIQSAPLKMTGNTIEVYNATGWAPDIDFLELDGSALLLNDVIATSTETISANNLNLHPNPTDGILFLNLNQNENLTLFSLIGETLKTWKLNEGNNNISISEFKEGVYFLKTENELVKILKK